MKNKKTYITSENKLWENTKPENINTLTEYVNYVINYILDNYPKGLLTFDILDKAFDSHPNQKEINNILSGTTLTFELISYVSNILVAKGFKAY